MEKEWELTGDRIFQLGTRASTIFPATQFLADGVGSGALAAGAAAALALWGWALIWLALAVASTIFTGRIPFGMSWWDLTFPPGMLALTTIVFGDQFDAEFFSVLGTVSCLMAPCYSLRFLHFPVFAPVSVLLLN